MAAEASGMFTASLRAKCVVVSTSVGSTADRPGKSSTSSKVSPSLIALSIILASRKKFRRAPSSPIKQRSPAGARWAGKQLHQIEKMHHRESSILKGIAIPVKLSGKIFEQRLARLRIVASKRATSQPCQKEKPGLTRLSQPRSWLSVSARPSA
jgi:hypothetical protein